MVTPHPRATPPHTDQAALAPPERSTPALLSQRLKQLELLGVVQSAPKPDGRGHYYELTSAGHDLFAVCQSLGEWGARWLEIAPENLDPFVALWSMCNALRRDRLPDRRVVIRFDFTGRPRCERYFPHHHEPAG